MTTKSRALLVSEVLNGVIYGITTVVPLPIHKGEAERLDHYMTQQELGVLIGITGEHRSQLVLDGDVSSFANLAKLMYGMELDGDMLESFVGEIGNMVGGNMCTYVSNLGYQLDITHPTVLVGRTKLTGFKTALSIPVGIESIGNVRISLLLEEI